MEENSVFIDANVFIAELSGGDTLHGRARGLLDAIRKRGARSVTSNYVISEVITVLSQRVGKGVAVAFAYFIYDAEVDIDIITVNREIELEALNYLRKFKSKNVSFCDCVTFAILELQGIKNIATFDKDFKIAKSRFQVIDKL